MGETGGPVSADTAFHAIMVASVFIECIHMLCAIMADVAASELVAVPPLASSASAAAVLLLVQLLPCILLYLQQQHPRVRSIISSFVVVAASYDPVLAGFLWKAFCSQHDTAHIHPTIYHHSTMN